MNKNQKKTKNSFTLVEVVIVVGIMGIITGGLVTAMREIIDGEILLKKMQQVEGESRFIMDIFSQDAQYSELDSDFKKGADGNLKIKFLISEKKADLGSLENDSSQSFVQYRGDTEDLCTTDENSGKSSCFLERTFKSKDAAFISKLNTVPLVEAPIFKVQKIEKDDLNNYIITISLLFRVDGKSPDRDVFVPIQTSVVSRTFEF